MRLDGAMGDKAGARDYSALSAEPTAKWRATISNPVRRAWARRYLEWIGAERLATMGYDLGRLRAELAATEMSRAALAGDAVDAGASIARDAVKARFARAMAAPSSWGALLRGGPDGARI